MLSKGRGTGGHIPGYGGGDTVPAFLERGEFVVRKEVAKEYLPELQGLNRSGLGLKNSLLFGKEGFRELLEGEDYGNRRVDGRRTFGMDVGKGTARGIGVPKGRNNGWETFDHRRSKVLETTRVPEDGMGTAPVCKMDEILGNRRASSGHEKITYAQEGLYPYLTKEEYLKGASNVNLSSHQGKAVKE